MAATGTPTPNLGLRRAQGTDPASVDDINYNSELLDTKLGAVGATSVQGQINALSARITKNKMETETDISSYSSSSNRYTIPSDGYITVINNSGASGYIIVQGNSGSQYFRIGGNVGHFSLFVREGLKVYTNGNPTNAYYYLLN